MLKDDRTLKHYSEAFKLQILSELESGKYTKGEISLLYAEGLHTEKKLKA